jgi:FKBP-type peptidyl-prolyl cis-trans isomerase FklB
MINAQDKKEAKKSAEAKTPKAGSSVTLKTTQDSVSYAIGQNLYMNLKDPNLDLNLDIISRSLKDASLGTPAIAQDRVIQILTAFQKKMQEKQAVARKIEEDKKKELGDKNKKTGDEFLAANKTKEGVITTASGLQYKVIEKGTGPMPADTDTVKVDYKGSLLDGREFDSSYKRGTPAEFPLNRVIKGWTEGLKLMHVGDKFQIFVPSELAYGEQGPGGIIEPNSVLVFDVKLLEVKAKAKK